MRKPPLAGPALALLLAVSAYAQRVEAGFLDRTVTVAGQSDRSQVYVLADCWYRQPPFLSRVVLRLLYEIRGA